MINIIKVTFTPKRCAPTKCKEVSYLYNEEYPGVAVAAARELFKLECELYEHYEEDVIGAIQRVL